MTITEIVNTTFRCSERRWFELLDPRKDVNVAFAPTSVFANTSSSSAPGSLPRGIPIPSFESVSISNASVSTNSEQEEEEQDNLIQRFAKSGDMSKHIHNNIFRVVKDERNVHPKTDAYNSSTVTLIPFLLAVPSIPPAATSPIKPREDFVPRTSPPHPPSTIQRESVPTNCASSQGGSDEPPLWRWRRFVAAPPIQASVSFLNDPHSAHIVLRGIQSAADTVHALGMSADNQLYSLIHGLMKVVVYHNAL